jgi:ABC-type uncharacterized transport system permease subunit
MYFKHLNRKNKNRSQIIISTIFSLMISIIVIYISLYPILSILKNLKETSDYYQTIANAISIRYIEDCAQKDSCAYDLLVNTTTYSNRYTCNSTSSISRQSVCYLDIITTSSLYATPTIVNRTSIGCNLEIVDSDNFKYNFSAMTKMEYVNYYQAETTLRRNFLGRYNNSLFILNEVNKLAPFCEFP